MSEQWQSANNDYLAASLRWLRLRLRRLAPPEPPVITVPAAVRPVEHAKAEQGGWSKWFGGGSQPVSDTKLLVEAKQRSVEEQIADATRERDKLAAIDPPPALVLLAQRFGLSPFERDTILLSAASEFDPSIAFVCGQIQGSTARAYPTFALALSLFDDPNWDAVAPHRPLRYARLVEISQSGPTPLTSSPLRADERIVNFLKGANAMDERFITLLTNVPDAESLVSPSQQQVVQAILDRLRRSASQTMVPIVQLVGMDPASRVAVAQQVASALNRRLYKMSAESLPATTAELDNLGRLWQRESMLLPVALYADAENTENVSGESSAVSRFLTRELGLVFLGAREALVKVPGTALTFDVGRPTTSEQYQEWKRLLDAAVPVPWEKSAESKQPATEPSAEANEQAATNDEVASQLAGQFNLSFQQIRNAALSLGDASDKSGALSKLWAACREITRPKLDALAQHLDSKATWDDIVLPGEQSSLLRLIVGQVRERHRVYDDWGFARQMSRGFGISALFTGESGVGKTMAAEVIANELNLNLYRIDLSAVVSKYIGETEKNLRRLFDAAELGGAILFFDEADALFGKRSEVKDSHDRYANIEINYLLQRMEAFSGLAILATNMKNALDPAFLRRLRFVVNFGFPGVRERKRIWERALPSDTPKEDLDYDRLARISITGGNIHSIALNAAFAAAQQRKPVTMPTVLNAVRIELRKLEKPINEAELR
jgi:AAA+ superfamily predicted ATPase